jgi:small subunit ribosomal protein S17
MAEQVTPMRPNQKTMVGIVVSDKMDKTVVVSVQRHRQHRLYGKTLRRTTRYKAHDPNNVCKLGDTVRLVETRPISKEKRWRVLEILQHKEVAEIKPSVIGQEIERPEVEAEESPAATVVATAIDDAGETEEPLEAETER